MLVFSTSGPEHSNLYTFNWYNNDKVTSVNYFWCSKFGLFEKKGLFLLIVIRVDLYHRREVRNTRSTVPVIGAPVVVVARNICAQEKQYKLSARKMKENMIYEIVLNSLEFWPPNYYLPFLKVGIMTDFLSTAGLSSLLVKIILPTSDSALHSGSLASPSLPETENKYFIQF